LTSSNNTLYMEGSELVSEQEEANLAKRYQAGVAARNLLSSETVKLSPAQKARVRRVERMGFDAREKLILANRRLVLHYAQKSKRRDVELDDLVQEGMAGLMRAVDKYQSERGYRFSTYATHQIRQAIGRAIDNTSRPIRVPVHRCEQDRSVRRAEMRLVQKGGGPVSDVELAKEAGVTLEQLRSSRNLQRFTVSLDASFNSDDEQSGYHEKLSDAASELEFDRMLIGDALEQSVDILAGLSEQEKAVLTLRFGLDGAGEQTLASIGTSLGLSRERIRQIESKALSSIRNNPANSHLRDLVS